MKKQLTLCLLLLSIGNLQTKTTEVLRKIAYHKVTPCVLFAAGVGTYIALSIKTYKQRVERVQKHLLERQARGEVIDQNVLQRAQNAYQSFFDFNRVDHPPHHLRYFVGVGVSAGIIAGISSAVWFTYWCRKMFPYSAYNLAPQPKQLELKAVWTHAAGAFTLYTLGWTGQSIMTWLHAVDEETYRLMQAAGLPPE